MLISLTHVSPLTRGIHVSHGKHISLTSAGRKKLRCREDGFLLAVICDENTTTGFLFASVGDHRPSHGFHFFVVDPNKVLPIAFILHLPTTQAPHCIQLTHKYSSQHFILHIEHNPVEAIEEALTKFTEREGIFIILIDQYVRFLQSTTHQQQASTQKRPR